MRGMSEPANAGLRIAARQRRRELDEDYRARAACRIQRRFLQSNLFFSGRRLACYIAMPDEVDTSLIFDRAWRAGKSIFAPVTDRHRQLRFVRVERNTPLRQSRFGLWEPASGAEIPPDSLDVILTPLVAFDADRHRIGMGGGYYDACFSFLNRSQKWLRPKLVGLAFDCQKVEKITPNPWDIRLYRIVTERQ